VDRLPPDDGEARVVALALEDQVAHRHRHHVGDRDAVADEAEGIGDALLLEPAGAGHEAPGDADRTAPAVLEPHVGELRKVQEGLSGA
jgi:hypothetical protein